MLAVYVSGHGFGHSTRTAEVLRAVRETAPKLKLVVNTTAPASLFEEFVAPPVAFRRVQGDVGLAQKNALVIDEEGSLAAWRVFMGGWDGLVAAEAEWLRKEGARLVLGDIPPLAFAAAARANVPSLALGNFSWDWIYRHLSRRHPGMAAAASWAAAAYREAGLLLRLPFAGDLGVFPSVEDVPLVARRPVVAKADARQRLHLDSRPVVLLSFGGIGLPALHLPAFDSLSGFQLLLTEASASAPSSQVRAIAPGELAAAGLRYPDLIGAVDVVISKPGYGIVSDCIGAATRLVYTDRGDFPEYPVMVAEMGRYLPAVFVSSDDLREGRVGAALEHVLEMAFPQPPPLDGARVVAGRILQLL